MYNSQKTNITTALRSEVRTLDIRTWSFWLGLYNTLKSKDHRVSRFAIKNYKKVYIHEKTQEIQNIKSIVT